MTESLWPNRRTLAARDSCVLSASDDWLGLHKLYVLRVFCPFGSLPTEQRPCWLIPLHLQYLVCAVYVCMCITSCVLLVQAPGLFNLGPEALLMRQKYKELAPPKE